MVSANDPDAIVGSVGERGLLKHAIDNPQLMSAEIAEVMEPPFPSVAAGDPVREAVELLSGEGQAITVSRERPPRRHRHARGPAGVAGLVTRFATRVVHAGLDPDPAFGGVVPPIHQASTYVQKAPGEFVGDYDYSRSANPTRTQLEKALGELEGGHGTAFSSGMAGTHALITAVCTAGAHAIIPSDLYGGTYRLVDKVLSRWGLEYTMVDQSDLDAVAAAVRAGDEADLGRDADQPVAERRRRRGDRGAQGRRLRGGRQHVRDARSTSGRWSSAPTPSCTPRRSTSAGTPTPSAAP